MRKYNICKSPSWEGKKFIISCYSDWKKMNDKLKKRYEIIQLRKDTYIHQLSPFVHRVEGFKNRRYSLNDYVCGHRVIEEIRPKVNKTLLSLQITQPLGEFTEYEYIGRKKVIKDKYYTLNNKKVTYLVTLGSVKRKIKDGSDIIFPYCYYTEWRKWASLGFIRTVFLHGKIEVIS